MQNVAVIRTYIKLGILNMVQYRANFFFELFGVFVELASALFGLAIVFNQTTELNGWKANDILILIAIRTFLGGAIAIVIRPSFSAFMEAVRLGTLDFILTKPADSQALVSVQRVNGGAISGIVIGLAALVYGAVTRAEQVGLKDAALFVLTLLCGVVVVYSFLLMLTTLAFWFVRLDNVLVIFDTSFGIAGSWPLSIYPGWLRMTLTFLIPVAFAVVIPAEGLTGRLNAEWATGAVIAAVGFSWVSRRFWKFGMRHYTGASA